MITILDCTLRDGGYYTDWDFEESLVSAYLKAASDAGIDMIELGLRNYSDNGFKGPFYFTTESFINSLSLPDGPEYGVMIDAKTILQSKKDIALSVSDLFVNAAESKLSFVRLACHFDEVLASRDIVSYLISYGYDVFVNVMQISMRSDAEITKLLEEVSNWGDLQGLYFADSLGNMNANDIERVARLFTAETDFRIGIHAHNNMGLALSNTLAAMQSGVTYFDATISGMGRGAGNAEMELLVAELETQQINKYRASPLASVVMGEFKKLRDSCGWGPSLHYYIAAKNNIHPTYIQTILNDDHFSFAERAGAIDYMKKMSGKTYFDRNLLTDFVTPQVIDAKSKDVFAPLKSLVLEHNSTALIIGAGEQSHRHSSAVKRFVLESGTTVFGLNDVALDLEPIINFRFISHNAKQMNGVLSKLAKCKAIIAPLARFSADELSALEETQLYDLHLDVQQGNFDFSGNGCVIPAPLTAAYAFAGVALLGVKNIFLVGFDGFGAADPRQKEMSELFHIILKERPELSITALTPTTYPINQGSIYAPIL